MNKIIDQIKKTSFSLVEFGINDLAWKREEALEVIKSIMGLQIAIIGGDVYKIEKDRLIPLGDNWHCEPYANETADQFYLRSKRTSLAYIEKYPIYPGELIVFGMVFQTVN